MTRGELNAKYCLDYGAGRWGQKIKPRKSNLKTFTIIPYWPNGTNVKIKAGGKIASFVASGAPEVAFTLSVKAKTKEDAIEKWNAKYGRPSNAKFEIKEK